MILSGWSRLSYLTCLDGLLTASKVAQEFEFTPLRHAVTDLRRPPTTGGRFSKI